MRGDSTLDNLAASACRAITASGEPGRLTEDRDRFTALVRIPTRGGNP
ncbi:MAG: hypothetical protein MZV65_52760 [Chromatiales bacterium]|nr:hypothetical protein [Chromatiales bacterium]